MQKLRLILAVTGAALVLPLATSAQSVDDLREMSPQERREYIEGLSPEERETLRAERRAHRTEQRAAMREHWQSLSDEEREAARQAHRERVEQRRQHWESMSEEDKAAARQRFRDHRGNMHRKRIEKRDGGQP
jgi:hypothetical protein